MVPKQISDAFPKPGPSGGNTGRTSRPGVVNGKALADFLKSTVIVGGVLYIYNVYVNGVESNGMDMAARMGLGEILTMADKTEITPGVGLLKSRHFYVVVNANIINVSNIETEPGKKYLTAWYTKERWGFLTGNYRETVDVIRIKDNYRVYNIR